MILVDTNVLARSIERGNVQQQAAVESLRFLRMERQEQIVVVPQVLIELYAVSTRAENSLHLTPEEALREIASIKANVSVLPETPELFPRWEHLVAKYRPTNRRVFDVRLVASMLVHNIPQILSFNDQHFRAFTEIRVLNPFDLLGIPHV